MAFFFYSLSWFAFSPLIPDVIKTDLKLTSEEVGTFEHQAHAPSVVILNAVQEIQILFRYAPPSLYELYQVRSSIVRTPRSPSTPHISHPIHIAGYGPRKVMATLLIIGAIPSGLAGTVSTANGLYIVRFFIGILGGTFVSCQAWNTVFFDKNVVGTGDTLVKIPMIYVF
jgi:NNP family nitrate/nitrite transporter-like MFS transporter